LDNQETVRCASVSTVAAAGGAGVDQRPVKRSIAAMIVPLLTVVGGVDQAAPRPPFCITSYSTWREAVGGARLG